MKKTTQRQGFVTLTPDEVREAILVWLQGVEPPIYADRVDSVDSQGATVLIWTETKEGLINEPMEEPAALGPEPTDHLREYLEPRPVIADLGLGQEQRLAMLKARLKNFARTARLDMLRASRLQRQLIEIANEEDITDDDKD